MTTPSRPPVGYAYPWDVVGDDAFPGRVRDLGVERVALAAAYHSVRAATPMHPSRRLVTAPTAALNRPVRAEAWAGRRLVPAPATWVDDPDAVGTAAATLAGAGTEVLPWIVLTHATRLGEAHPDVAVTNCWGEAYPYALCPQVSEVREYAATLAAEAVRDLHCSAVVLEACGQLGLQHGGHHDKTDGAYDERTRRLLSVCCCTACRAAWLDRGLDAERTAADLRAGTTGPDVEQALLEVRHAATDLLRREVIDAVRGTAGPVDVVLHAEPDPWATGALPGLTPTAPDDVDEVVTQCWPTSADSADKVAELVAALDGRAEAAAYVTVLPPTTHDDLGHHLDRLVAAGASRLHLYHLGLAGADRQPLLARTARSAP